MSLGDLLKELKEIVKEAFVSQELVELRRGVCTDQDIVPLGEVSSHGKDPPSSIAALRTQARELGATIVYFEKHPNHHPGVYVYSGTAYRQKTPEEYRMQ